MHFLQSQFHRSHVVFLSLLILLCIAAVPDRQWAKAPAAQCPTITLGPNVVQGATVGSAYSLNLTASGGQAPYNFSIIVGSLPPGLTLTPSTGRIAGTPTTTGSYNFTARALDANACTGNRSYTISVICPAITLGPGTLPTATIGVSYSQNFSASGGQSPYAYSLISGSIPPGMIFGSGGSIGGTATATGTYSFLVRATDDNGCTGTRAYTLTVGCPNILIFPANIPSATIGVSYSQTFSAPGGKAPTTFSISSGSMPPGMIFGSGGTIGGTPTIVGTYSFTISVTDANNCTDSRSYTLNVNCPDITIAPAALPGGTVGASYSQSLTASGGKAPYTFSLFVNPLPPGLSLSSSGSITGTPTSAGSYGFTLRMTDANSCTRVQAFTIVVDPGCPPITITPLSGLPDASTGVSYSQTINANGGSGPYTFDIVGIPLPPGLSLSPIRGITGTPTTTGTYSFQVRATDSNGCTGTRGYTITVACGTIALTPASLPNGAPGVPYSQGITASGSRPPYGFLLNSGTLPPGLSLNTFGALFGTPTTAGNYSFSLRVSDGNNCSTDKPYTINVACPTITINPATLPAGTTGAAYNQTFSATGGTGPYAFGTNISALPPGLTWNTNGSLSGTPTTAGSYSFNVVGNDANGCIGSRSYTLVINNQTCPTITISPATLPNGTTGAAYSQTLSATGGASPYEFNLFSGTLPPGVALTTAGLLSGTPAAAGSYNFIVRVSDANNCIGARNYTVVMDCPTITINPPLMLSGRVGVAYSFSFGVTGGRAPYTFSIVSGTLPSGLTFTSPTISGTPTVAGDYNLTVRVTDANGCTGERSYRLVINNPACPTITLNPGSPLPPGTINVPYSQTITASGGADPYTYSIASSDPFPPGLGLSSAGVLMGAPTASGTYNFILRANDANGCRGDREYTLVINNPACPTITINPATLPGGTTGAAYNQTFAGMGGAASHAFSISTGTLPTGLSLGPNGNLSGTPTTAGSYSFTVRATDANGCTGERGYTIVINNPACPTITINPATLPAGTTGAAYNQTFAGMGGAASHAFSISTGTLPTGLSLGPNGNLSGTPTAAGSYSFTVRATDANGCTGERSYTIVINSAPCPSITINPINSPLPAGRVGTLYGLAFTGTGGTAPYVFSITGGALPGGLTLSPSGNLTGTPTTAGSYFFNVRMTDANGCVDEAGYDLVINNPACPAITVNPTTLPAGTTGTAYNQTLSATGGAASYAFSISTGTLPTGLSLGPNGNLSGTPTAAGSYSFTVRATDANGCAGERGYTIVISNPACPTITINPATLPAGRTSAAYNQTITATGGSGSYSFSVSTGTLPTGLSLASNGALTGAPASAGNYSFTVRATDANGCTGERQYTVAISNPECPAITVNPATLPAGVTGTAYSQTLTATGGTGPYSFSISTGALPTGLSLSASGALTGTPSAVGNFSFTVRATAANGCAGERSHSIAVAASLVTSVSAASYAPSGPLAPESIVAAFGSNMATGTQIASTLPLPTELAGVNLKVRDGAGTERLAPLFFVSPTQINYQIPPGTGVGSAGVTVTNGANLTNSTIVATGVIEVANVSPGLFSADASGRGVAAANALRIKSDGTQSYEAIARFDAAQNRFVAAPIDLGPATDQVFLVLYGTGFKFRSALSAVSCAIGGVNGEVLYAGEVAGLAGLDQINARLPRALAGRGEVDVIITVDGKTANTVRVAIR